MTRRRRTWAAALALLVCAGAACAQIPTSGPVREGVAPEISTSSAPFDFTPAGPTPGATPTQVVSGYLTAQQATPSSTTVARSFLTDRADERWEPERGTLLYQSSEIEAPAATSGSVPVTVRVGFAQVFALDGSGRWLGDRTQVAEDGLVWTLVRERDEWRIADPPDALLLPLAEFDSRFRRMSIFFADPTGSVLIPEPVYLPMEVQTPTQLVEALLAGPRRAERFIERTFLPMDTELEVSVPVTPQGVAQVPLSGELLELDREDLTVAMAQLVWTLRQVPEVRAVTVTADGAEVSLPGGRGEVAVTELDRFSPLVNASASELYGLRRGSVRRFDQGRETLLMRLPRSITPVDLGVSLIGNPLAVATAQGRVHVLARGSDGGQEPTRPSLTFRAGSAVGGLAWDWSRSLWSVPARFDGSVRTQVGKQARTLRWPDPRLDGREVAGLAVSRDGSRIVLALVSPDRRGSELWSARISRAADQDEDPLGLRSARKIRTATALPPVVEIGWRDAQTLAVLVRRDRVSSQVLAVPVDGQRESGVLGEDSDVLFGAARAMASSPVSGEVLVTTRDGLVHVLSEQGRWRLDDWVETPPVRSLTFVG